MSRATVVIPCYNEGARLDEGAFAQLVRDSELLDLLFVDDGSRDNTVELMARVKAGAPARIRILRLDRNRGKAEAVREGLLAALAGGADVVGYYDADLATPPVELLRLVELTRTGGAADVVLASRVMLLGRAIERSSFRHYIGRVFATAASIALRLAVYDTQCGAKLFRRSEQLSAALREPFMSRWAFDVELLGRLLAGSGEVPGIATDRIVEEPLRAWRDIPGSKLRAYHMLVALVDITRIARDLRRRRSLRGRPSDEASPRAQRPTAVAHHFVDGPPRGDEAVP